MTIWPRNAWYAAAWDHEVGAKLSARTICGTPVLLYRSLAGAPPFWRSARGKPGKVGRWHKCQGALSIREQR